jgi:hypothetical protein
VQDHVWFLAAVLADSTLRCCDAETAAAVSKVLLSLGPSLSELDSAEGAAV